jgi:hypothetical protein
MIEQLTLRNEVSGMKKDVLTDLVEKMDHRLPDRPVRSLCELKLSTTDYENLCRWVKEKLNRATVQLSRWKAGAIIFNVITEVARREAVGHCLWPIVADKFSDDLRAYLFPNNHPCQELKSLIQRAARELRLRHVFDDEESQSWYITTHLQFGFTQPNFIANLPEWLCGHHLPDAMRRLLTGELASESFRELWQALRYFRRDWITEEQLRSVIDVSPWILPDWKNDLVRLSRERLHLIDVGECDIDTESQSHRLVGLPRFEWPYGLEPVFRCDLEDLQALNLTAPHYHVFVGDVQSATLFRQNDGKYRSDRSEVTLPAHLAQVDVKLLDGDGHLHISQLVELWDSTVEVCVFELPSGKPLDVGDSMSPAKSYVLFMSPDLEVVPGPETWMRLRGRPGRLAVMLRTPWDIAGTTVVTSDRAIIWTPPADRRPSSRQPPPTLSQVRVQFATGETARVGSTVRPVVRGLPEGAEIAYVRLNGRAVSFDNANRTLSAVVVSPEDAQAGLDFDIGLRCPAVDGADGQTVRVKCRVTVDITGVAYLDADGWLTLPSDHVISSRDCRDRSFRVFVPREFRGQNVALMEGPRLLRWIRNRAGPFGRTYGMGAPLVVRSQPYNSCSDLLTIAKAIVDGGIVESVKLDEGGSGDFHLVLSRQMSLSPDHCIIAWPCGEDREAVLIDHSNVEIEGRRWVVTASPYRLDVNSVVAIAYKGNWLGSAIHGDVLELLRRSSVLSENMHLVASLVRWFRLPVLLRDRPNDDPAFANFAHSHPEAVMAAWLGTRGLPYSLTHDNTFDRRQLEATQLRELYLGWSPTSEQAHNIVVTLGHNVTDPLGDVVLSLFAELPLITGQIILHWLKAQGTPENYPLTRYMSLLRYQVAPKYLNGRTTTRQMEELRLKAAESMKAGPQATADEHFVQHAIVGPALRTLRGGSLALVERNNLAVAIHVASFRQYLAMCVLTEVERELQHQ